MRHTRVLTIVTLAVLSSLSFVDAQNVLDTPHRRAVHHLKLRATNTPSVTPSSSPPPSSSQSPAVDTSKTPTPTSVSPSTSSTPTSSSTPASSNTSTSPAQSTSSSQPSGTTSSTPTSTSSQTSSTPSSTSSSSNTSSSSSSSTTPTTSTTPVQPNRVSTTPLASNSFVNGGNSLSPDGGSTVFATPTVGATSKGFFANKAAVAATFSIIGIICGLAAIIGAVTLIKRYRRSRNNDDDFYEKYPGARATRHSRFSRDLGTGPLGASATDLSFDAAPPAAYPDRAIHYGQPNPNTVFRPVDYGIDYPPHAAYADANAASASASAPADRVNSTDIAYEQYDYDPNRRSMSAGSHPFADPVNAPRTAAAPSVTYPRTVQGRAQEMVTVDSYYGPNSAGVGATGTGYAQ